MVCGNGQLFLEIVTCQKRYSFVGLQLRIKIENSDKNRMADTNIKNENRQSNREKQRKMR